MERNLKKRALWALGLAVSLAWPLPAGSKEASLTVEEVLGKVEKAQGGVKDVQMNLRMEINDKVSNASSVQKALIQIKTPGKLYAHYTSPQVYHVYITGGVAQMYHPEQAMVYRQALGGEGREPVYFGVGRELKRYAKDSRVSVFKDSKDEVGLLFLPNGGESTFSRMKVTISKKNWWPVKLEFQTPSMTSKASFSKFSFNQELEDKLFKFTPPKDAQIVEGAIFQ